MARQNDTIQKHLIFLAAKKGIFQYISMVVLGLRAVKTLADIPQ